MSIKVGDKVKVVDNRPYAPWTGEIGEVLKIFEVNPPVAYIVLENEKAGFKIPVEFLKKVEPKAEFLEGAKQISRADFYDALKKITDPKTVLSDASDPIHAMLEGMAAIMFGHKLADLLFKDTDVAVATEDDFVRALWKVCDPAAVADNASLETSAYDGLLLSLSSVIKLRELVPILFGGSDD